MVPSHSFCRLAHKDEVDPDLARNNSALKTNTSRILDNKYSFVEISDNRRPTFGVLSEPLRGDIGSDYKGEKMSYIPKAHVQFLEQAGVRVVPISYLDSEEDIL